MVVNNVSIKNYLKNQMTDAPIKRLRVADEIKNKAYNMLPKGKGHI